MIVHVCAIAALKEKCALKIHSFKYVYTLYAYYKCTRSQEFFVQTKFNNKYKLWAAIYKHETRKIMSQNKWFSVLLSTNDNTSFYHIYFTKKKSRYCDPLQWVLPFPDFILVKYLLSVLKYISVATIRKCKNWQTSSTSGVAVPIKRPTGVEQGR